MSEKTLLKKVNTLKELEVQKKALENQMSVLQEEIKREMEARGSEEAAIGDWIVRFKAVMSNKFNSKAFATDHPILYKKYMASAQTMRFTVQ
jgi:predicted phage-related endonuclease